MRLLKRLVADYGPLLYGIIVLPVLRCLFSRLLLSRSRSRTWYIPRLRATVSVKVLQINRQLFYQFAISHSIMSPDVQLRFHLELLPKISASKLRRWFSYRVLSYLTDTD